MVFNELGYSRYDKDNDSIFYMNDSHSKRILIDLRVQKIFISYSFITFDEPRTILDELGWI